MSRLWPDRLYVSLEPEAMAVCRFSGKNIISRAEKEGDALENLKDHLVSLKTENLKVTVVLSNRLVRYAVVPFDAGASTPAEEQALARFHFTRIYGERAKTWDLRLAEAQAGRARLACAIDEGLLGSLRECFPRTARPRLVSVQPWLMAAFNRWQDAASRPTDAWLVLLERERACLALSGPGGWQSVQSLRLQEADEVLSLLERESLRAGDGTPRKALVVGGRPAAGPGWELSYSNLDERYAMALSAA